MSSKLIFLLLSALFLAQCSLCKPMPDEALTPAVSEGQVMDSKYNVILRILGESSLSEEQKELFRKEVIPVHNQLDRFLSLVIDWQSYHLRKAANEFYYNLKEEEKSEAVIAKLTELKDLTQKLDFVLNIDGPLDRILALEAKATKKYIWYQ